MKASLSRKIRDHAVHVGLLNHVGATAAFLERLPAVHQGKWEEWVHDRSN